MDNMEKKRLLLVAIALFIMLASSVYAGGGGGGGGGSPKHKVCRDGLCVSVDGSGSDACSSNSECRHTECSNGQCITINDDKAGIADDCTSSSNCRHNVCMRQTDSEGKITDIRCQEVFEPGIDQCSGHPDCNPCLNPNGSPLVCDNPLNEICYDKIGECIIKNENVGECFYTPKPLETPCGEYKICDGAGICEEISHITGASWMGMNWVEIKKANKNDKVRLVVPGAKLENINVEFIVYKKCSGLGCVWEFLFGETENIFLMPVLLILELLLNQEQFLVQASWRF